MKIFSRHEELPIVTFCLEEAFDAYSPGSFVDGLIDSGLWKPEEALIVVICPIVAGPESVMLISRLADEFIDMYERLLLGKVAVVADGDFQFEVGREVQQIVDVHGIHTLEIFRDTEAAMEFLTRVEEPKEDIYQKFKDLHNL